MKKAVSVLFITLLLISACVLSACGKDAQNHTHAYGNYIYSTTEHWRECSCGEKTPAAEHSYNGDTCTVCGYKSANANQSHTHAYGNYIYSTTEHWRECSCGEKVFTAEHTYNGYTCTVCGYVKPVTKLGAYELINIDGGYKITGYDGSESQITIPSHCMEEPIIELGERSFADKKFITGVTIPDTVKTIGDNAFDNCTGLNTLELGNGVESIGKYAFKDCGGLTSVTIPDSVKSIGFTAFGSVTAVYISDMSAWVKISHDASSPISNSQYSLYLNGELVTDLVIPSDVTGISDNAFNRCGSLTSVTIPGSVTSIGNNAFYYCTRLASITISNGVTSIGEYVFNYCGGLKSITIPSSVTSIGDGAFNDCTGLAVITVAEGNTKYHSEGNCLIETESKTLTLGCKNSVIPSDGSVTSIGYMAFDGCIGLTNIAIPNGVTSIDNCAFRSCTALTDVTIPDSVTSIGNLAFSGCVRLTSITIPSSVTGIAENAFLNGGIETVYYGGTREQWEQFDLDFKTAPTVHYLQEEQ